jgi:NAD(P)-dependent dehydrogenase (short-subunit alcohol dehydrogenase family)
MDLQLQDKHILITGGSRGIGLACARQFLAEGARVTLVGRDLGHLDAAKATLLEALPVNGSDIRTVSVDLRDAAAAAQMVDRVQATWGPVDVLVNCAGAAQRTPPDELTPSAWHDALQAKFFTYIHVIDPLIKHMARRGQGAIVNVVGIGGKVASPIHLPGGSANAALMLASAGLAAAYAGQGVRVNVVNPALTQTDRVSEGVAAEARMAGLPAEEVLRRSVERYPMGRIAQPREVADAVVFLASPRASYINGAALSVDGALNPLI